MIFALDICAFWFELSTHAGCAAGRLYRDGRSRKLKPRIHQNFLTEPRTRPPARVRTVPSIIWLLLPKTGPARADFELCQRALRGSTGHSSIAAPVRNRRLAKRCAMDGHLALRFITARMEADRRRHGRTPLPNQEDGLIVVGDRGLCRESTNGHSDGRHADLPKSIEAYYQKFDAAGRDGAPLKRLTLFVLDDIPFAAQPKLTRAGPARNDARRIMAR